jgi:hypothetical protein
MASNVGLFCRRRAFDIPGRMNIGSENAIVHSKTGGGNALHVYLRLMMIL